MRTHAQSCLIDRGPTTVTALRPPHRRRALSCISRLSCGSFSPGAPPRLAHARAHNVTVAPRLMFTSAPITSSHREETPVLRIILLFIGPSRREANKRMRAPVGLAAQQARPGAAYFERILAHTSSFTRPLPGLACPPSLHRPHERWQASAMKTPLCSHSPVVAQ